MQGNEEQLASHSQRAIIIIGPVSPFRGGIAQHTTMLARALADSHVCRILSFKRLYPKLIFPGQSDRDPDHEGQAEPRTEYLLDTLNPFTWRRVAKRAQQMRPDFVLIPWWTFFLGPLSLYIAWALRRRDIDVVFFCHNVLDHEETAWKRALARLVLRQGSRFVVHTRVEESRLKELIPGAVVAVHPHPIYDQFPEPKRHLPRRAGLELLFYGFVRPYKGLDVLTKAIGLLKGQDVFLTVAGEFWQGEKEIRQQIAQLAIEDQVEIISRYVSDQETAQLFDRSDLVILPYRSATGSGVIPIAYHYGKPVIATRVGGLPDVVWDGKTGRIVPPGDVKALANAIREMTQPRAADMRRKIEQIKRQLTWHNLAKAAMDLDH